MYRCLKRAIPSRKCSIMTSIYVLKEISYQGIKWLGPLPDQWLVVQGDTDWVEYIPRLIVQWNWPVSFLSKVFSESLARIQDFHKENMVSWDRLVSKVIDFLPRRSIAEKYLKIKHKPFREIVQSKGWVWDILLKNLLTQVWKASGSSRRTIGQWRWRFLDAMRM